MDDLLTEFLTEANESLAGLDEALLTLERAPGRHEHRRPDLPTGPHHQGHVRLPGPSAAGARGPLRRERARACCARVPCRHARPDHRVLQAVDVMKDDRRRARGNRSGAGGRRHAGSWPRLTRSSGRPPLRSKRPLPPPAAIAVAAQSNATTSRAKRRRAANPAKAPASLKPPRGAAPTTAPTEPTMAVVDSAGISASPPQPPSLVVAEQAASKPTAQDVAPADGGLGQQTIRVSVGVLENLMTLVSELVLTRNQLLQISRSAKDATFAAPGSAPLPDHERPAGRDHEDPHAADRFCMEQAAAAGP